VAPTAALSHLRAGKFSSLSHWKERVMNDARRMEIQRALTLIEQAKGILEAALAQEQEDFENMPEDLRNDETGQRAEDAIDALERATTCCDEVMSACEEAI
jgi:hypothetical protein